MSIAIANNPFLFYNFLSQRGVRHSDSAECGHQEALEALSERHARQEGIQGVQTHETCQPQKREPLYPYILVVYIYIYLCPATVRRMIN